MALDRPDGRRLQAIIEPYAVTDGGVAISIQDADGRVLAAAGSVPDARAVTARREIVVADRVVGRVDGQGTVARALLAAIVDSVATTAGALLESAVADRDAAAGESEVSLHRIEAELALGRQIQRSFVPLIPPDLPGYEVASQYEAAREVGGDFFDVFRIQRRQGRLAVCIADVTGKGIAAALLMAFARPLLHAAIDHALAPGDALERTNKILVEERRSALFITALCGSLTLSTGRLRLANAGHESPLIVRRDGSPIAAIEGSGSLLGAFPSLDLAESVTDLAHGDIAVFYTDGVTDAQSRTGERFEDARLFEAIESARGGSAGDVVESIRGSVERFQAGMLPADDITIVAVGRRLLGVRRRPARSAA